MTADDFKAVIFKSAEQYKELIKTLNPKRMIFCLLLIQGVICMNEEQIILTAIDKYRDSIKNKFSRECAWNLCYKTFKNFRESDSYKNNIVNLCAHLSSYLATFGMYRNSVLLEVNHLAFQDVIPILFESQYRTLDKEPENHIKEIIQLGEVITEKLQDIQKMYSLNRGITDTLISKIILGTYGCVVAYDDRVTTNLRKLKKIYKCDVHADYCEDSIKRLYDLYETMNIRYYFDKNDYLPKMRQMDIILWFGEW